MYKQLQGFMCYESFHVLEGYLYSVNINKTDLGADDCDVTLPHTYVHGRCHQSGWSGFQLTTFIE